MTTETGRFAPSTTGPAHPGTLLAALLCWLDARAGSARLVLRLEDLDPDRCRPEWAAALPDDLAWLGLDFDAVELQSRGRSRHEAALDQLARQGLLYPCSCTRREIREQGRPTPAGGFRYPGSCRARPLPAAGWRATDRPLRVRLPPGRIPLRDESGLDLSGDPEAELGDPVVLRRDGAVAYQLASVVDDAALGVTRIVRGRDLAGSSALQVVLRRLLGLPIPAHRHHLLLLEARGEKLAKLHGAVGTPELRQAMDGRALCGVLAVACGLREVVAPVSPGELLGDFDWSGVRREDRLLAWRNRGFELGI